jgi:hypothetical protein
MRKGIKASRGAYAQTSLNTCSPSQFSEKSLVRKLNENLSEAGYYAAITLRLQFI